MPEINLRFVSQTCSLQILGMGEYSDHKFMVIFTKGIKTSCGDWGFFSGLYIENILYVEQNHQPGLQA